MALPEKKISLWQPEPRRSPDETKGWGGGWRGEVRDGQESVLPIKGPSRRVNREKQLALPHGATQNT